MTLKKILALLLAVVLCFLFAACDGADDSDADAERIEYLENQVAKLEQMAQEYEQIIRSLDPYFFGDYVVITEPEPVLEPSTEIQQPEESSVVSIYTAEELFTMDYDAEKIYILENDIDLSNYSSSIQKLNGVLDGNGKTIYNISAPLVLDNNGILQNLTAENVQLVASENAAALVVNNYGTVTNCRVSGSIVATAADIYAGGLVSWNKGTIENCVNYAEITAVSYELNELGNVIHGTFACAGGICAYNNGGMIFKCWNEGTITAKDADYLSSCGGIVAFNSNGEIENCFNKGVIVGPGGRVDSGGIAGNNETNARIVNCYNIGAASSGICGDNRDYLIDCYYLSSASKNGSGSGLNPEGERIFAFSESELTLEETFSAFDFSEVWKMSPNGPVLQ